MSGLRLSVLRLRPPPGSTLFPYTTLFRSQSRRLSEADFRGEHFRNHSRDLKGCNDLLALTQPQVVEDRSEEHTSELQSHSDLVCRLLLEKKNARRPGAPQRRPTGQTTHPR